MDAVELRTLLADQAARFAEDSPLQGRWCAAVGAGAVTDADLALLAGALPGGGRGAVMAVLAGLHAVLQDVDDPLRDHVPTLGGSSTADPRLAERLTAFVTAHVEEIAALLGRAPVANDPRTGVDLLRAAALVVPDGTEVDLLVVGAAAGLELVADDLADVPFRIVRRRGVDLHPVDPADTSARRWLLGVCPPDDVDRFRRTERAADLVVARGLRVEEADAVEAVRTAPADRPLVVAGGSVLCMLTEPERLFAAVRERRGETVLVSSEVTGVHRLAGRGEGLEEREPADRVVRATLLRDGVVLASADLPPGEGGYPQG